MASFSRRLALKVMGACSLFLGRKPIAFGQDGAQSVASPQINPSVTVSWKNTFDRVWLGETVWANPMEDWAVVNGAAECLRPAGDRSVHLITHRVTNPSGLIQMSAVVQQIESLGDDGGVGFRLGIRSDLNEPRSNCFASGGINAGIAKGFLVLGSQRIPLTLDLTQETRISLTGQPAGAQVELILRAHRPDGEVAGEVRQRVATDAIVGNLALVNNFDLKPNSQRGSRYRFMDWRVGGDAVSANSDAKFGPILWSMYSLSDSRSDEGFVLKMTALTGPLGADDRHDIALLTQLESGPWTSQGTAILDADAWTATFRIGDWDASRATLYRLTYRERHRDGSETEHSWSGTIRPNPIGRPLRIGALTCQNDYAFPYSPVAENLLRLDPDLLYFSGDQIYESHGGFGLIRTPADRAILNYLRKYYMFGWAFRDSMRNRPTLCIPDDHDVFQGNIWGEEGAPMLVDVGGASSNGGYIEPARMVNVVHKTNVSHHPDFFDATPVQQGISVYYGDMVYGGVGFAILGDRQFKSGPQHVDTGSGRADHVVDRDFDTSTLDQPGLKLLGERQEDFLKHWASDWRGHTMKVLLSQTVFAGVATHHGTHDGYLKADLDSGGWPQTARDRAIELLLPAMPLHINGDQHLTSLVQYGIKNQRDACWSFCTPAIAVGYQRWWRPDELEMPMQNRPQHQLPDTGEYLDGFGNRIYVYAVGNPETITTSNRYERAHQKGSGFGLVTVDPQAKTYRIEAFRFLVNATDGNPANQFPGWPVVIHQSENKGENRLS